MVTWSTSLSGRDTARGTIMGSSGQCSRSLPSGRITPEPPRPALLSRGCGRPAVAAVGHQEPPPAGGGYLSGSDRPPSTMLTDTQIIWVPNQPRPVTTPPAQSLLVLNFLCALTWSSPLFSLPTCCCILILPLCSPVLRADSSVHAARWRWCVCRQPSLALGLFLIPLILLLLLLFLQCSVALNTGILLSLYYFLYSFISYLP